MTNPRYTYALLVVSLSTDSPDLLPVLLDPLALLALLSIRFHGCRNTGAARGLEVGGLNGHHSHVQSAPCVLECCEARGEEGHLIARLPLGSLPTQHGA